MSSEVEEYVFSFRLIVPDKSPDELESICEEMTEKTADESTPLTVSNNEDVMILSFNEDTEFPDVRLSAAVALAKSALHDFGIINPMFINAYAILMDGEDIEDLHDMIVYEDTDDDDILDLTDELIAHELKPK